MQSVFNNARVAANSNETATSFHRRYGRRTTTLVDTDCRTSRTTSHGFRLNLDAAGDAARPVPIGLTGGLCPAAAALSCACPFQVLCLGSLRTRGRCI
mgnify:CR=1 FL=1